MIRISDLQKKFQNGSVYALNGINLEISAGEFVVMIGSNGSGKSTLLNAIAGSVIPDKGKIFFDEIDVTNLPEHSRSKWIARVFQNPLAGSASELTIAENFRLAGLRTSAKTFKTGLTTVYRKNLQDKISSLNLGLENKLDQPIGNLSGGQRQALTLLMAVMDDTKLLLMDEPVAALDPGTAATVMKLANDLIRKHQLTCIMVTHSMRDVNKFGDRIIRLSEGKIVNDLNVEEKKNLKPEQILAWF